MSSDNSEEDLDEFYDAFVSLNLGDSAAAGSSIQSSDEVLTIERSSVFPRSGSSAPSTSTLVSGLHDQLVRSQVWNSLNSPPTMLTLQRLRRINRSWRSFVDTTVEWSAMEFTRLDTPGYNRFITTQQFDLGRRLRYRT